jgi:hypothetical protein
MTGRNVQAALVLALVLAPVSLAHAQAGGTQEQNPTQEIANETPAGPAFVVGPTELRIGGYLGITGIHRSTNSGGEPGSNFESIPYGDVVQGHVSETRLTPQASRLSLRVDAAPEPTRSRLSAYFEVDFNGTTPGTAAVSSHGFGLRMRHAFGEAEYHQKFFFAAGQAFTLMTPSRNQLSVWPSDFDLTMAVDTNYLAGMVWARSPQIRFTYRSSPAFNWAISAENPEQQLGPGVVKLPACCAADLGAQYNTGSGQLGVPNLMPDIVSRIAINSARAFHLDAGGVLRVFRHTLAPYDDSTKKVAGGVSVNSRVSAVGGSTLLGEVSYGRGLGRYIGGLAPDASISADGTIHPIRTTSWVAGAELRVLPHVSVAGYFSGLHVFDSFSVDADGSYIGYGYPGSPRSNNRDIREWTGVVAWQPWNISGRGSLQCNTQVSWVSRTPWSRGAGPASADALMVFTQVRYNLP